MAKRTHDLAVVVGSYQDRDGNEKKRYANVGVMMEGENGPFILLDKHFNPAGVSGKDGRIVISCFKPKDGEGQQGKQQNGGQGRRDDLDDDLDSVPF